ncbi:MAG: hypothetical protein AAB071_06830 [Bacteroidota bacterium]
MSVQVVTNTSGKKTAVLVPFDEWKVILQKNSAFDEHKRMYNNLKTAFQEVKDFQSGKKKAVE